MGVSAIAASADDTDVEIRSPSAFDTVRVKIRDLEELVLIGPADSSYVYWAALLGNGLVPNQIYRIPK